MSNNKIKVFTFLHEKFRILTEATNQFHDNDDHDHIPYFFWHIFNPAKQEHFNFDLLKWDAKHNKQFNFDLLK